MSRSVTILLSVLLLLVPLISYFGAWHYFAVNIPKWDDHAIKAVLLTIREASTFQEQIAALFSQHNEHRIVLTRLFAWIDTGVFGAMSFRHLMVVGNLLLFIVPLIWALFMRERQKAIYCLIPVFFFWFSLAHWENTFWGMASIQNFGVVVLVVATIFLLLSEKRSYFIAAIILAFITVFTSGNGITVLPLGMAMLAITRRWRQLGIWSIAGLIFVALYFLNFEYPSATNPDSKASLIDYFKGYLLFLGSFAESLPVQNKQSVSILAGSLLLVMTMMIVYHALLNLLKDQYALAWQKKLDLFALTVFAFILGTGLIVVYGRTGFGIETLLTSRYKIYSLLLVVTIYLYLVIPIKGSFLRPFVTGITVFAIIYHVCSFFYYLPDIHNLRHYLTTSKFNWTFEDQTLTDTAKNKRGGDLVAPETLYYDQWLPLLQAASEKGIAGDTSGMHSIWATSTIATDTASITITNPTYASQQLQDNGVYMVLASQDRYYLYPTYRDRNTSRKTLFINQHYFAPGFRNQILMAELVPNQYRVGLVQQRGNQVGIVFQQDSVTVQPSTLQKVQTNW